MCDVIIITISQRLGEVGTIGDFLMITKDILKKSPKIYHVSVVSLFTFPVLPLLQSRFVCRVGT